MFLKELIEAAETLVEDVKDELQAVDIFEQIIWPDESELSPVAEVDVPYQLKATPSRSCKARIQSAIAMLEVANSAIDAVGGDVAVDLCPMLDGIKDQLEEADVPG